MKMHPLVFWFDVAWFSMHDTIIYGRKPFFITSLLKSGRDVELENERE